MTTDIAKPKTPRDRLVHTTSKARPDANSPARVSKTVAGDGST